MKLIVCGKGGSGKSTVTSLLARQHARTGNRVVVVDTDVSNAGLHRILGTAAPPDLMGHFGGKAAVQKFIEEAQESDEMPETPVLGRWRFDELPEGYHTTADGVRLVAIGKLLDATEGCTCTLSALTRQFIVGLELAGNDLIVVDTEAGVEHFGRGIDTLCDAIVMVVDPSYESICLVGKISDMAASIGVPLFLVLNKTDAATSAALRNTLKADERIIGEFGLDPALIAAGLEGRALPAGHPEAAKVLQAVADRLAAARPAGA